MSQSSQKHRDFVSEPMGEKTITALAGIGEVLGARLEEQGFDKVDPEKVMMVVNWATLTNVNTEQRLAYVLLGQFLLLKKDEDDLFKDWLKDFCGANARQAELCSSCLKEWCAAFL